MSVEYRKITYDPSEPASNENGDMWIKNIVDTYQIFLYFNGAWSPLLSGGQYIVETDPDDHYYNIYVQNAMPTTIRNGWFWFKISTQQLYIYLNRFVLIGGY